MIRAVLVDFLLCLVAAGCAYWVIAWGLTSRFLRRSKPSTTFVSGTSRDPVELMASPRVSILKPVKGSRPFTHENFESFCRQDYNDFEILFGVRDEHDPAIRLIQRLQAEHPQLPIRLFVAQESAINPKCAILQCLARHATGDVLVLSDDDICVTADYLATVIAPLEDPSVGWVTCPYRALSPIGISARLEALHMDAVFLPAVVLANAISQRICMGATIAVRKADLIRAGGLEAIADYLMDDYQLASIIAALGLRGVLSDYAVGSALGKQSFAQQWGRETRWSRGIRVTCPAKYWGLLLTFPTVWAVALAAISRFSPMPLYLLAGVLLLRWVIALDIRRRLHGKIDLDLLLLPLRDGLSFLTWIAGAWGRHIEWRGQTFILGRDGRLAVAHNAAGITLFQRAVRRLDAFLRKRQGIFEFDSSPECILRISFGVCDRPTRLSDGTTLSPGDPVCDLHLFNDHIPPMGPDGPTVAWASLAQHRIRKSMATLAGLMQGDGRFANIRALRARFTFFAHQTPRQLRRMAARLHFDLVESPQSATLFGKLHDFGENLLVWALIRTFNPGGMRNAELMRVRHMFFISKQQLLAHYAPAAKAS